MFPVSVVFPVSTVFGATDETPSQPSRYDSIIVEVTRISINLLATGIKILKEIISTTAPGFKAVSSLDFLPGSRQLHQESCRQKGQT